MTVPRRGALPRWIIPASLGLSILAVGLTAYLTVTHYTDAAALACPNTGIINCTAVTTSSWSVILGVPVALIGLLWAFGMTALNSPWAWRSPARWIDMARLVASAAGAVMVIYLVYVELFRVAAICLWCTGVHLTAVALFAATLVARASLSPVEAMDSRGARKSSQTIVYSGGNFKTAEFSQGLRERGQM